MRASIHTLVVTVLAVGLLGLFLRQADFGAVWATIRSGDPVAVLASAVLVFVSYALRAWRWQYLLAPMGRTSFGTAFRATVIGFAASFLLPARAGEFLRPWLLARREGMATSAAFATILLERVLDLIVVVVLLSVFLVAFDPGLARLDPSADRLIRLGGAASAAGALGLLGVMVVLARNPDLLPALLRRLDAILPARMAEAVARLARTFAEGLAIVRQPARLAGALAASVPLWAVIGWQIWWVSHGLGVALPASGTLLVMALLVVGVAVPTPGAVGGFHEAYRIGVTTFFAANNDRAVAAAIVLHATGLIPTTLIGIWMMTKEGLTLGRLASVAEAGAGAGGANL